jgi:hypothetical protein
MNSQTKGLECFHMRPLIEFQSDYLLRDWNVGNFILPVHHSIDDSSTFAHAPNNPYHRFWITVHATDRKKNQRAQCVL